MHSVAAVVVVVVVVVVEPAKPNELAAPLFATLFLNIYAFTCWWAVHFWFT
jgi:hypothetical protein